MNGEGGGTTTEPAGRATTPSRRRRVWRAVAVLAAATLVVLVGLGWWAGRQGYVSWGGTACTDEGYDPVPSYDELVTELHQNPYCARRVRGETWF